MATRLVSATPTASQPTGSVVPSDDDLPQDNLILEFNAIIWVLVAVSGFFFILRAYCKITRQRGLWWDDHVMGAAWVSRLESSAPSSLAANRAPWNGQYANMLVANLKHSSH